MPAEEDYRRKVNERIGQAVRNEAGSCGASSSGAFRDDETFALQDDETFAVWMRTAREKQKRKRRHRAASVAAVFVCLFLCAGMFGIFGQSPAQSGRSDQTYAGSSQTSQVEEQNGSIVIGGDGNGNAGTWTATFTSYEDIPQQYQDEIIWFETMPEGYELQEIKLQRELGLLTGRLIYSDGKHTIQIKEEKFSGDCTDVAVLNDYNYYNTYNNIAIYQKAIDETKMYTFLAEDMLITVIFRDIDKIHGDDECLRAICNSI